MINRFSRYAAAVLVMGFTGGIANATVIFTDPFNTEPISGLNVTPAGWTIINGGTVDTIPSSNIYGITCDGTNYCIDTDGSTGKAGEMVTLSTFSLVAGQTYQLTAEISGNQRNALTDLLRFGFLSSTNTILDASPTYSIPGTNNFNLYTLTFTPSTTEVAKLAFLNVGGTNDVGPILDTVTLQSVPLPASAWLLLSALAGVGLIGRRRLAT